MHRPVLIALTAAALACHAPMPAGAADVTPDQARALEAQVRTWISGILGPDARIGDRPIQVTPDGERYRIAAPIGVMRDNKRETLTLTATARQADGRWTIDDVRLPFPARFTITLPQPPADGKNSAPASVPVTYIVDAATQDSRAVWDPAFATPSTWALNFTGLQVDATGAGVRQSTRVARSASLSTLRPAGADRVDVVTDSTTEGYASLSKSGDTEEVRIAAGRVRVTGELTSVSRERAGTILQALIRIGGVALANLPKAGVKAPTAAPGLDMQPVRAVLQAMEDFASEFTLQETADDVAVSYGAYGGKAAQLSVGMGAKSDQGILQAHMDFGLDGLMLPDIQLGAMAALVPKRIALRPVLSGVATKDLLALAVASTESKDGSPPGDAIAQLFSRGGISAGLESFVLDIGGATFAGMGAVLVPSPDRMSATAQITATNFDALMQTANGIPELAGVLPLFTFAKGLARTVESRLVWDVTYRDGRALVNGTDLSAMMGGGRK